MIEVEKKLLLFRDIVGDAGSNFDAVAAKEGFPFEISEPLFAPINNVFLLGKDYTLTASVLQLYN